MDYSFHLSISHRDVDGLFSILCHVLSDGFLKFAIIGIVLKRVEHVRYGLIEGGSINADECIGKVLEFSVVREGGVDDADDESLGESFKLLQLDGPVVLGILSVGLLVESDGLLESGSLLKEGVLAVDFLYLFWFEVIFLL